MPRGIYERTPEHNAANSKSKKGVPKSPEHGAAISKAKTGIPRSQEACDAIARGREKSGANDKQRGGLDFVNHHFIYDHDNPENHTVEITRSQHVAHHHWMRRNGLKVPHINVTEDNKDIFK